MKNAEDFKILNSYQLSQAIPKAKSYTKMHLSSITMLDDIVNFSNLKELNISAMNSLELYEKISVDTLPLVHLENLEKLYIENDDHISKLYLGRMKKLKSLFVSSCHTLNDIYDLKHLENLEELIIYDVPNIDKTLLNELVEFVKESVNLRNVLVDINFFNYFNNKQLKVLKENSVRFVEKLGLYDNYIYSFKMMEDFNKKVLEIYNFIHDRYKDFDDVLFKEYQFVKNTEYDYEALAKRVDYTENGGKFYKYCNRYKAINSSYTTLMKKRAVCEGYVNLLKYFYNLEGVNLYPVTCYYNNQFHVAAKALINGVELYFDPELDNRFNNHNNYGISNAEFLRNHDTCYKRDNFDRFENINERVREM